MEELGYPLQLQAQPDKKTIDAEVAKAKGLLLKNIKRSVYAYRVDCGGCNACEIEIFASITPLFDAERFGIKVVPSPRHADLLIFTGAVTRAMRMPAVRAYEAAPDPKIVVSYGACGCSGGIFHDNYCVWGGTDKLFPVDLYIPGCPPTPAQTIYGFAVALGLLDQKQHRAVFSEAEDPSPVVPYRGEVPYRLRVALEREARRMSGYRYGRDLADEFMDTLLAGDHGVMDNANRLIATQTDPRRAEVFARLKDVLTDMVADGSSDVLGS